MKIQTALADCLSALSPTHLELANESHQHAGYFEGKESHFKAVIVSAAFTGKRPVARHQSVYALAAPLLTSGGGSIHALALHTYTPEEWQIAQSAPDSPNCQGRR